MSVRLCHGDMREVLATYGAETIDAVVCDPPYELGFMGKRWDGSGVSFDPETWRACYRVLKPGGHLLAFGGTRTVHRIAVAIEDAGFEIRDQIAWLFGSGFPKSLDVARAIHAQETIGGSSHKQKRQAALGEDYQPSEVFGQYGTGLAMISPTSAPPPMLTTMSEQAKRYDGYGTALKPAMEPIVVARKPLIGTVAANVTAHGTGALNIDGCRIGVDGGCKVGEPYVIGEPGAVNSAGLNGQRSPSVPGLGRWPANVVLDEVAGMMLDAQDSGGASRFFYCAKASRQERNAGLQGMPNHAIAYSNGAQSALSNGSETYGQPGAIGLDRIKYAQNHHPTVKPVSLMRWLVRMVCPPDGAVILDPFLGSGTTGVAAVMEGVGFVGIEQSAEYLEIARRRIAHAQGPLFAQVDG